MTGVTVDNHEFREYAATLDAAAASVSRGVQQVVSKGALNIKTQMIAEALSSRHFKGFAPSISYDITAGGDSVEAEIGPVKGAPGSLANIAYFGTSRGGGTVADPSVALEAEAPNFEKALADLMANAVK